MEGKFGKEKRLTGYRGEERRGEMSACDGEDGNSNGGERRKWVAGERERAER